MKFSASTKPLLAICRGHQLLNIALGGKLIVDIRQQVSGALNHQRLDKAGEIVHEAALTADSLLAKIVGKKILGVNSFTSSGRIATGGAADGHGAQPRRNRGSEMELKPAVSRMLPFLLSVQFHTRTARGTSRRASGDFPAVHPSLHSEIQNMKAKVLIVDDEGGFARVAHLRAGGLLRHRPGRHGGATGKTFSAARARRRSARRENCPTRTALT